MEILLDASAIMAVIVKEPERDLVIQLTQDATIFSPDMVSYEIANGLTKMMKKKKKKTKKSPLEDIPYITADITTQEMVELLRESRSGI